MNGLKVFVIIFALLAARAAGGPPAWDARSMPLPAQGVSCVDVSADGRQVAVGTIAAPGEPNVIVLSREGRILREATVGQRWVEAVAATDDDFFALVTMPAGRNRDTPTIFSCGGEPRLLLEPGGGESSYPRTIFAYGDHSNHVGVRLARSGPVVAAVADDGVTWLAGAKPIAPEPLRVGWPDAAVATAFAVHRSGRAVAGFAAYAQETPQANLFLVDPAESKPRWSRPAVTAVDRGPPPPAGTYGAPTLPDGTREPLPQRDLPVVAPLAIACGTGPTLDRIAVADYAGWQRWIRSAATGRDRDYGTRFMPGRPTITVYDAAGAVVRRFDSAAFTTAVWVDLAFLPGDEMLVAFPHRWTSRGLGGLPARHRKMVPATKSGQATQGSRWSSPKEVAGTIPALTVRAAASQRMPRCSPGIGTATESPHGCRRGRTPDPPADQRIRAPSDCEVFSPAASRLRNRASHTVRHDRDSPRPAAPLHPPCAGREATACRRAGPETG